MMKRVIQGSVCLAALLLLGAGMASAQVQGNQQQKCINKVNKAAGKVAAAQSKANNSCVKDYVLSAIPNADACVVDDPKDKVEGKQANVLADETKNCISGMLPDFGYTSGMFAGTTAYESGRDLVRDVFGNPVDSGLFICDTNPAECLCQRQTISRISKLYRALNKIWVKCKKAALKINKDPFPLGADSAADLAECVTNGGISLSVQADTKGKILNATTQMSDTIGQFCSPLLALNEFDGGVCANLSGAPLVDCFRNQAECRFCKMVDAYDNLPLDCATWSGAGANCP